LRNGNIRRLLGQCVYRRGRRRPVADPGEAACQHGFQAEIELSWDPVRIWNRASLPKVDAPWLDRLMTPTKSWRDALAPATPAVRLLLRLAITVALAAVLLAKLDIGDVLMLLARIGRRAFLLSVVLLALSALLAGPRWHVVLRCYGVAASFPRLVQLYLVGNFFNQVLPSSVGGDAVRIWYLKRQGVAVGVAARSVIVDRLIGLAGMVVFVALGLPVVLSGPADDRLRLVLTGVVAAAITVAVALACMPRLRRIPSFHRPLRFLAHLAGDVRPLLRPRALVLCAVLTLATNCLPILAAAVLGYSLAIPLSLLAYAVIVPAALIISLVPVSIAGWGVREAAMVVCMAPYGVSPETALALSIAFGVALTLSALPGGLIWFLGVERPTVFPQPKSRL
jgi:uncharacterized membrane protein YbhN (UPF0104 family)